MIPVVTVVDDPASAEPKQGAFLRITMDKLHPLYIPDICWSVHALHKHDGEIVPYEPLLKGFREGDMRVHITEWSRVQSSEQYIFMTKEAALIMVPLMSYPRLRFELAAPDEDIRTSCVLLWSSSLKF